MQATYDPAAIEARWYSRWEEAGLFRPEYHQDGTPFCIVMPPPNVTGVLHLGHALDLSIADVIIRRKRMQGYAALWLPGTDHAGIATQNVVERALADEGIDRHELGRDAFVERVWAWKGEYGGRITDQIRRMGFSCDWSRERFTFDEGLSRAVREVFVSLYEDDLIYRGERIISWCPRCGTALADIEVEHSDEAGELVDIFYPFAEGEGGITVATTRVETMLGDTAVAVHPDDERYSTLVGRAVVLPLVDREIPIVADEAVDPEFGTGAVKVTPAHDPNDFEIAERHGLAAIKILDKRARITAAGGRFEGLDRFEARAAVKHALEKMGALKGAKDHHHSVGHCSRCDTVVEPLLSRQWFVSVGPLVGPAIAAVKTGENQFVPKRWEKNYFHWMENLRDWCISRQLWWGHRIPAWYCQDCSEIIVTREDPDVCPSCGGSRLEQDPDVLDTWFSSQLWPFSTLGWPEKTPDLERFYPNDVLVTGFDIIYFWVARMMKSGLRFMGEVPFRETVIHGMVRDQKGVKMSKSRGNTVDPLDLADEYGVDPLRLALLQAAAPGHDVPLHPDWVAGTRKFGNKVWNAFRFALGHLETGSVPASGGYPEAPGPVDRWILHRLGVVSREFDELCDQYRFSDAFGLLYNFAWAEVFDWYLEMLKPALGDEDRRGSAAATLGVVLRDVIKLFHPAIPYLTEELWEALVGDGLIAGSSWPQVPAFAEAEGVPILQDLVTSIRSFRAKHGIGGAQTIEVALVDPEGLSDAMWVEQALALSRAHLSVIEAAPTSGSTRVSAGRIQAFVAIEGTVDVAAERTRIDSAIAKIEAELTQAEAKLGNDGFRRGAPDDVVANVEAKAADLGVRRDQLRTQLAELE